MRVLARLVIFYQINMQILQYWWLSNLCSLWTQVPLSAKSFPPHIRNHYLSHLHDSQLYIIYINTSCPKGRHTNYIERSFVMNNLNSVLIEGNLVRDPEYRTTTRGTTVCKFSVASNRFYKQDDNLEKEVGYFDVEAWGKIGESVNNHGRKGRGVRVVGRLKQERWESKEGKPMTRVVIVAEHVEYRPESKKNDTEAEEYENGEFAEAEESLVPTF